MKTNIVAALYVGTYGKFGDRTSEVDSQIYPYMNIHKYPAVAGVSGHYLQVPPGLQVLADGWPGAS